AVEMILDHALVASGHENEVLDACLARFVDHMLDERPIDHREHFLRHGLGGRQEPGAEAGDRENGFADLHWLGPDGGAGQRRVKGTRRGSTTMMASWNRGGGRRNGTSSGNLRLMSR